MVHREGSVEPVGTPVSFRELLPASDELIRRQMAMAIARGLPEADGEPLPVLRIIANGPSALDIPLDLLDGPTLAINGALRLFKGHKPPTWWAACDPQALVADFLEEAPAETTYLVASKCHPSVFDRLEGRDVRLWHVGTGWPSLRGVPTAVSVTLCAMTLMHRLGWRRFETWGWDGCFLGGQHHAAPQFLDVPDTIQIAIGAELDAKGEPHGGKLFRTTGTWAMEAQDAVHQLSMADYEVDVRGPGMIGELLRSHGVIKARPEPFSLAAA